MAKRTAGWGSLPWLLFLVLVLVSRSKTLTAGFLQVEMAGKTQMVFLNKNATVFCKIPDSPHLNIRHMGVTWFWKSRGSETEVKVFEFFGNHKMAFRPGAGVSPWRLERGDASLQLPAVQLGEAGEYRCELVVTPQKAQGRVQLEVVAHPVSSVFQERDPVRGSEDRRILCKSSGFYPDKINITWTKWPQKDSQDQEVSEGIVTGPTIKNEDGTYNVTSYLRLKPSLEDNMTVYQCVVWHPSLLTRQSFNFTLTLMGSEKKAGLQSIIQSCLESILIILIRFFSFLAVSIGYGSSQATGVTPAAAVTMPDP
uniref:Ig-like domain-containing protein n=1 Tax=Catagonus wagneri TaxID=51154 RepID=A0A8C3X5P7_9CETA